MHYNILLIILLSFYLHTCNGQEYVTACLVRDTQGAVVDRDTALYNGIYLWQNWTNSRGGLRLGSNIYQIRIVTENSYSATDSTDALTAATNKLIQEDGCNFIIGPFGTDPTVQMRDLIRANATYTIPFLTTIAGTTSIYTSGIYPFMFNIGSTSNLWIPPSMGPVLARHEDPTLIIQREGSFLDAITGQAAAFVVNNTIFNGTLAAILQVNAGVLDEAFLKIVDVVRQAKTINHEFLYLSDNSDDLEVFSTVFAAESYTPKVALLASQLTTVDEFLLQRAQGWLVHKIYHGTLRFGTSGIYMGTTQEYEAFFTEILGYPDTGIFEATASAGCLVWQIAAELCGDNWKNLTCWVKQAAQINNTIFYGHMEFDQHHINYGKHTELFYIQSDPSSNYSASVVWIENPSDLTIPTAWPWATPASSVATDGDGNQVALIVGVTIASFCFLVVCCVIVLVILLAITLKAKYHLFMLRRS